MGYSRKNSKKGRRRTRNSFSKKSRVNRKRGGCSCKKRRPRKLYGGESATQMPDLNKPIYDYTTSPVPYRSN